MKIKNTIDNIDKSCMMNDLVIAAALHISVNDVKNHLKEVAIQKKKDIKKTIKLH